MKHLKSISEQPVLCCPYHGVQYQAKENGKLVCPVCKQTEPNGL